MATTPIRPLASILARYRAKGYDAPKKTTYGVEDPEGGGYLSTFFDDIETGVAFEFDLQDELDPATTKPAKIVVHRAAKPALPAKNATPATAVPTQRTPVAAPPPEPPPPPRPLRAFGNGMPLTEKVNESGSRGWSTNFVLLPSSVLFNFYAFTSPPPGGGGLWHPLVWMNVTAAQDHAVWQDVSAVTLAFGGRRLQLDASKQTTPKGERVYTSLDVRVPFRDFLDLGAGGQFLHDC